MTNLSFGGVVSSRDREIAERCGPRPDGRSVAVFGIAPASGLASGAPNRSTCCPARSLGSRPRRESARFKLSPKSGRSDIQIGHPVVGAIGLVLLIVLSLVVGGCSGVTEREVGIRADIPLEGPEPGELEARAAAYVEEMTALLEAPYDDPVEPVVAIGEFLEANTEGIIASAQQIEARMEAMSPGDRAYYEEQFAAFFAPTLQQWRTALVTFRQANSVHAARLDGLLVHFD